MSTLDAMQATRPVPAPADESAALAEGFARRMSALAARLNADERSVLWAERAALAMSRATAQGHVCLPLAALARRHDARFDEARDALLASGVACLVRGGARADAADLLPLVIDEDGRLYLARYFDYERRLACSLVERSRDTRMTASREDIARQAERIARYFGPRADDDIDWQRVAAFVALAGRLTIVSGGPGTGKTTTVVGVLACLLDADPDLRIALAAPTGKAAQRMQEALIERADKLPPELAERLPRTSFTLQRLLGVQSDGRFRHHRDNPLPYDVIVVDEASMIDVALAAHLLEAVAPASRLVMLGDKDQLSAVEAGAVFAELSAEPSFSHAGVARIAAALSVDAKRLEAALPNAAPIDDSEGYGDLFDAKAEPALTDCVVWLQKNYRFGLDSDIGRLSIAIRNGDERAALDALDPSGERAAVLFDDGDATLSERTLARLAKGFAPYADALSAVLDGEQADHARLFDALNRFRVLCATRKGPRGVDEVNARIAAEVREQAGIALALGAQWFAGRPVIVTRNDYALGLFNGDIGIALPGADGLLRVAFRLADGALRYVSPAALPPHDTAFALTVHKSQGSEFEHAALVLPGAFVRVLSRELVYTAITRAKRRVEVIGSAAIFAQAVREPTRRDSGLAARMRRLSREFDR
ncbi:MULTISPECIES: exodeoxyribonuclease V subunit alpha [Caballeronia]|uniref:exodeoxyribonuclease V subunit alpha n=1 Tax=Caballeronia TaxID=1827195 RepID=UPI001588B6E3|nr:MULTISPECIES: exodeoxyribonuclease V subunit alpha [Caballeronia]MCG7404994.1 exodeoxyribonuclease V subunit alpha [Caballeronia zhejiangensis]MCI1042781.1 exodeoxyribonuclease V subunit alpha [Caballeronia zhejiangensis]